MFKFHLFPLRMMINNTDYYEVFWHIIGGKKYAIKN